jgi:hypothetical protein
MPPQFKPGYKPDVPPDRILVVGPWDYEDQEELDYVLDQYTVRLELIQVVLTGTGTRVERGGEYEYVGVDYHARRWAERYWWDRIVCREKLYPREKYWIADVMKQMEDDHAVPHCIFFRDGNDVTHDKLIEAVKYLVIPSNFRIVEV